MPTCEKCKWGYDADDEHDSLVCESHIYGEPNELSEKVRLLELQVGKLRALVGHAHGRMEDLTGTKFPKTVYLDHRFGGEYGRMPVLRYRS